MIIDAATVPHREVIQADLCIVGAGPAGLALAAEFIGTQQRVYVLETGGEHPDAKSREMSGGESVGHPYFLLQEARARVVGGSSYIWDEWMRARPLDPIDFEAREWIAHSGWPIDSTDLKPFYRRAHEDLGLGPFDYDVAPGALGIPGGWTGRHLGPVLFRFSNTADFTTMRSDLEASDNVCLVLNGNVLEVVSDESKSSVDQVVASSGNPQRFRITARIFVLAGGGLENPRLLLLSRGRSERGLANEHDQVGRYFMEHATVRRGHVVPEEILGSGLEAFSQREVGESSVRVAFAPTRQTMERQRILNGMVLLTPTRAVPSSEAYRSMAIVRSARRKSAQPRESVSRHLLALMARPLRTFDLVRALSRDDLGSPAYRLSMTVEQEPDPSSRVTLGRRRDRFGQPIARLHWRLGEAERRTVRVLQESLRVDLREQGLGDVEGFLGDEYPPRLFRGEWHHMGTTRMSESPSRGVVDRDCRVHGLANLYIAGSSVFPTVGYANPTLTIVALSMRLASHLRVQLQSGTPLGPIW